MISSKYIDRIVIALMVFALASCFIIPVLVKMDFPKEKTDEIMEYETALFDTTQAAEININISDDSWNDMLTNAAKKQWKSCDVEVNGKTFKNVGIRTKGDNSLEGITENPNSNRYSFKLEFDKYNDGQYCFGLDKLCLNNNYGDATNMKEALVYDMFQYMGAKAPLYNYAKIMVNGEYFGTYLMLEAVEDSFIKRNFGNEKAALYKPGEVSSEDEFDIEDLEEFESNEPAKDDLSGDSEINPMGGANLNYISNHVSDYKGIFDCAVNKTDKAEHKRTIKALKNISQKKNLEDYMEIDDVLKYMAIHNFSVNYDSLLGDGDHNYYLYEKNGRLGLIPWDYNLCFGAYECELTTNTDAYSNSAISVINKAIDDSWPMTSFFDGILENEQYLKQYHEYYQMLVDNYVLGKGFEHFYNRTRMVIDPLIKTDPSALYTYEQFDEGAKTLKTTVLLRGQSVKGQLDGSIPSTFAEQKKHSDTLIDGSNVNLQLMGGDGGMEDGQEIDAGQWDEEFWQQFFSEKIETLKNEKREIKKKNEISIGISLVVMCVAIVILRFKKRSLYSK